VLEAALTFLLVFVALQVTGREATPGLAATPPARETAAA
jgi:hypothetical protein